MSDQPTDFVQTRASLLKKKPQNDYQEVSFVAYKSKKKDKRNEEKQLEEETGIKNEFNVRKAKHEIIKFGMSGFDPLKKEEAKIQLLVKLGAKPPKNKYKNYKELVTERKKAKDTIENQQKFQQLGKNSMGKSTAKGKSYNRKRRKEGLLDVYGTVTKEKAREKLIKKRK